MNASGQLNNNQFTGSISIHPESDNSNVIPGPVILEKDSVSFEAQLTGAGTNFNLYRDFSDIKNKPFIISQTGAGYFQYDNTLTSIVKEANVKKAWYKQILNTTILTVTFAA